MIQQQISFSFSFLFCSKKKPDFDLFSLYLSIRFTSIFLCIDPLLASSFKCLTSLFFFFFFFFEL